MQKVLNRPNVLRLCHGAGQVFEVPASRVQRARKKRTLDALRQIASDEIRDPELIRTLSNEKDDLVIFAHSDDPGGVHEWAIPAESDFDPIAEALEQRDVELSAAVRHVGG